MHFYRPGRVKLENNCGKNSFVISRSREGARRRPTNSQKSNEHKSQCRQESKNETFSLRCVQLISSCAFFLRRINFFLLFMFYAAIKQLENSITSKICVKNIKVEKNLTPCCENYIETFSSLRCGDFSDFSVLATDTMLYISVFWASCPSFSFIPHLFQ